MRIREKLLSELLRNRQVQLRINELIANQEFKIPIHLALGHEAIAVSVASAMEDQDQILLNHRNIHYQIALGASEEQLISEYRLTSNGLGGGRYGSMNLIAQQNRNIYTSNILGNNLAVALGVAHSSKIKSTKFVTWAVTGDGALEEGIFFETLLSASSWSLPIVIIVENNQWSLGTKVIERRKEISLREFCNSLHVEYLQFEGNDVVKYFEMLEAARKIAITGVPVLVEVHLETLGGYFVEEPRGKRYINYHAGKAQISSKKIIVENQSDPIYVNTISSAELAPS